MIATDGRTRIADKELAVIWGMDVKHVSQARKLTLERMAKLIQHSPFVAFVELHDTVKRMEAERAGGQ